MQIVNLPVRWHGEGASREAGRKGLYRPSGPPLRLVAGPLRTAYCAGCASPIDMGAVWRQEQAFCSVECSLGGGRPA